MARVADSTLSSGGRGLPTCSVPSDTGRYAESYGALRANCRYIRSPPGSAAYATASAACCCARLKSSLLLLLLTPFVCSSRYNPQDPERTEFLYVGDVVQLLHRESEGFLCPAKQDPDGAVCLRSTAKGPGWKSAKASYECYHCS